MLHLLAQTASSGAATQPWSLVGAVVAMASAIAFIVRLYAAAMQKQVDTVNTRADAAVKEANDRAAASLGAVLQALPLLSSVKETLDGNTAMMRDLLAERRHAS